MRSVSGRIVTGANQGLPNVSVSAWTTSGLLGGSATTDSTGAFVVGGLQPISYRLYVTPPSPYRPEAWGTSSDPRLGSAPVYSLASSSMAGLVDAVAQCDPAVYRPGADLSGTDQSSLNLQSCDLTDVNLTGADLTDSDLTGATVANTNFTNATMTRLRAYSVFGKSTPILPTNWSLASGAFVGPTANLSDIDLTGLPANVNLSGANLRGARIRSNYVSGPNFSGADLTGATFSGTFLSGPVMDAANLSNAIVVNVKFISGGISGDLSGADFSGADLTDLTLRGPTSMAGTQLGTTTISGVHSGSGNGSLQTGAVTGTPASLPPSWSLISGYFVGPKANLNSSDLSGLDLRTAKLTGTNLSGASLRDANLSGIDASDAYFGGSNLSQTQLVSANLTGATFENAWFNGTNLLGATGNPRSDAAHYESANPTTCPDGSLAPTAVPNCVGHGFS